MSMQSGRNPWESWRVSALTYSQSRRLSPGSIVPRAPQSADSWIPGTSPGMTPMPRHVVARAAEIPSGSRKLVHMAGRDIVVFNIEGELFALSDKCPHKGGSLSRGKLTGAVTSSEPGSYDYSRSGEIVRCPWHGWEFDVRTGRSWCDPKRMRLMNYTVSVEPGAKLVEGPYVAETFAVAVEDDYVVVETKGLDIRTSAPPGGGLPGQTL